MKVWMLCEAFCLDCDGYGPRNALAAWALPCADRKTCMRELRNAVTERILENHEGLDEADGLVDADIKEVMSHPEKAGRGRWLYRYSGDDRGIVWRVYPCEVMGT